MSCYRLWYAQRAENGTVVFGKEVAGAVEQIRLPCGRCTGCRMERSQMWAIRCQHEASIWDHNCFVTLTYDDAHLPWHGSLNRKHLQDFLRRLRRRKQGVQPVPGSDDPDYRPIRFYGCGEYGESSKRAHYHLLLFNTRFEDRQKFGKDTYTSKLLSSLWPYGSHLVGSFSAASAAYVAGYSVKKVYSRYDKENAYGVTNLDTGEYVERLQEFPAMSLRPGIGQYWYDQYKGDLKNGYVVVNGSKVPVPRFYEDKYRDDFPDDLEERDFKRELLRRQKDPSELTEERLAVKEVVAKARKAFFKPNNPEI